MPCGLTSAEVKAALTNPEVLEVHKDPLTNMAVRIDVGGGVEEGHASDLCASSYSVYGRQLVDGSSAVMVLNRGEADTNVTVPLEDVGDSLHTSFTARDLWARANLSQAPLQGSVVLTVPAHGVRFLRLWPVVPPPVHCPADFTLYTTAGYWDNTDPCPHNDFNNCTRDAANGTVTLCAAKCRATGGCVAFEVPAMREGMACYLFLNEMTPPFTANEGATTCVRHTSYGGADADAGTSLQNYRCG